MALYKGFSEKSKVDGIKTNEARSMAFYKGLNKDKRSSFNGILQGIKTSEARSMAFYKGLSEKSKVDGTSEARSMAFYKGLSKKSKVLAIDSKNR
ncbi:hypothetical protein T4B_2931 [Trichinella pseudospiralis]|uniref:Uncharacterized protein n=1 Tax=Trichinella pseudospiralis TaxID=6337 RepID=A0A0V1GMF6_TRIPS|nr:hypothetical protein T4B_2931 [Trichinella pseudospiralis]